MVDTVAEDPRQVRTRAALTNALFRLLREGSLSSISVSALCEAAGVHRTTFYKHASSIEAFAVDVIIRALDTVVTVDTVQVAPLEAYREAMVDTLTHIADERPLYRPLLASRWAGALRGAIHERMQHRVSVALDVFAEQVGVAVPDHRDEIVAFVSGALVGTIVHWALSDDTDSEGWAARVQALMPPWWPIR